MSKDERNGRKDGFIKLSRRLTDWEWADDPSMLAVWVHCLLAANWKECRYHGEIIPRGSFLTSYRAFSDRVGLSESTIRRCFDRLESGGQIQRQVTHRGTLVKVLNYAVFQGSEIRTAQTDEQLHEQLREQLHEQQEKNIKNIKNKRERVEREKDKTGTEAEQPAQEPPSLNAVIYFCNSEKLDIDAERFYSYYTRKKWRGVTDWKARAKAWSRSERRTRSETLPEYYNAEPIRDPNPKPATAEEIETVRKQIQRGKL